LASPEGGRRSSPVLRRGWQGGPEGDLGVGEECRLLPGTDARRRACATPGRGRVWLLLNPAGEVVSSAVLHPPDQGPCKATYVLPLSAVDIHNFGTGGWPAGYRVQKTVTGHWTDVVLLGGGCNAVE
jgi:hypothetical protein